MIYLPYYNPPSPNLPPTLPPKIGRFFNVAKLMGSDFVANLGAIYVTFFVAQLSIATKSYPVCTRFMSPS